MAPQRLQPGIFWCSRGGHWMPWLWTRRGWPRAGTARCPGWWSRSSAACSKCFHYLVLQFVSFVKKKKNVTAVTHIGCSGSVVFFFKSTAISRLHIAGRDLQSSQRNASVQIGQSRTCLLLRPQMGGTVLPPVTRKNSSAHSPATPGERVTCNTRWEDHLQHPVTLSPKHWNNLGERQYYIWDFWYGAFIVVTYYQHNYSPRPHDYLYHWVPQFQTRPSQALFGRCRCSF